MAVNKRQCEARVCTDGWHYFQCSKKAVVVRGDKAYCKIHDPEYIKLKDLERQTKYEAGNCKQCGSHFYHTFYRYCPMCGTKRGK